MKQASLEVRQGREGLTRSHVPKIFDLYNSSPRFFRVKVPFIRYRSNCNRFEIRYTFPKGTRPGDFHVDLLTAVIELSFEELGNVHKLLNSPKITRRCNLWWNGYRGQQDILT